MVFMAISFFLSFFLPLSLSFYYFISFIFFYCFHMHFIISCFSIYVYARIKIHNDPSALYREGCLILYIHNNNVFFISSICLRAGREPCSKTLWMPQNQWQMKKRPSPTFLTTPSGRKLSCTQLFFMAANRQKKFLPVPTVKNLLTQRAAKTSYSSQPGCRLALTDCFSPPGPWWWQAATCQPSPNPGRCRARWALKWSLLANNN